MQESNATLPVELIRNIFTYLPPCEIVRLRRVSKQFREISFDPIIWRETYASARLPRPPGPFPWQSTRYLERTLVHSDLLSRTWTSHPLKTSVDKTCQWSFDNPIIGTVLFERWCIWTVENYAYYRDITTGGTKRLYRHDGGRDIVYDWQACSTTSMDGRRIFFMVTDFYHSEDWLRLVECDVNDDGLSEPRILDLRPELRGAGRLASSQHLFPTPFLVLQNLDDVDLPCFVFDVSTSRMFTLPDFTIDGLDEFSSFPPSEFDGETLVVPTRTHVIALRVLDWDTLDEHSGVVVQAFIPPDSPCSASTDQLRLTHQAVIYEEECVGKSSRSFNPLAYPSSSLLRNSVVDPVTKSVSIKILYSSETLPSKKERLYCLSLTLPEPCSTNVLPLHVHRQLLLESEWFGHKHTASEDGYARGILLYFPEDLDEDEMVDFSKFVGRKFTIDASGPGDGCTAEFSDPGPFPLPADIDWEDVTFDGFTGKLHSTECDDDEPYGRHIAIDIS